MNDAQDTYEHEEDVMGENIRVGNSEIESNGRIFQDTPPNFVATMRILRVEMQCYRVDKEIMVKAQEDQNQLNASMLQILIDIQRRMNSRDQTVSLEGSKSSTRRRKRSPSGSSDSEGSIGDSSSPYRRNKRRHYKNNS